MQTKTQKSSKEFIKDLLDTVPSNKYLSKALGVNSQTISNYRKKLSKVKGGPWSICPRNTRLFNPKIIEACIIHNCTAKINAVDTLEKVYNLAISKGINHPLPESMKDIFSTALNYPISQNKFPQLKQTGPDWTPEQINLLENLIGLKLNERSKEANKIANIRGCTANAVLQKFLRVSKTGVFGNIEEKIMRKHLNMGPNDNFVKINEDEIFGVGVVDKSRLGKNPFSNRDWTIEQKNALRDRRSLTIIERNNALKLLAVDFGRTFTAVQKEYSKLNIADRKQMAASKISALDEVRNRIAQATTVITKPESFKIIFNGKEVTLQTNMEYKTENNKIFLVQKETKVIETFTELQ